MFQLLITERECSALCPLFSADCKPTNGSETRARQPLISRCLMNQYRVAYGAGGVVVRHLSDNQCELNRSTDSSEPAGYFENYVDPPNRLNQPSPGARLRVARNLAGIKPGR
jgi:hypothetical protein